MSSFTYSHLIKILNIIEENKLIYTKKEDRGRYIYLTEKGKEVKEKIEELIKDLNKT